MNANTDTPTVTGADLKPWPELVETIRPQTDAENARLKASLEEHGQQQPVLAMPDGRIIDGYHRWGILGADTDVKVADVTEEQGYALGFTLNAARRQLSATDMRKIDAAYAAAIVRMRDAGATQQQVAADLGVAQSTVSTQERKARAAMAAEGADTAPAPDKRVKVNAAQRKAIVKAVQGGKQTRAKIAEKYGISTATVAKVVKEAADAERAEAEGAVTLPAAPSFTITVADRPRETGRRIHEALMRSRQQAGQVGAAVLRCAIEETSDPGQVANDLRQAMTSDQWLAFVQAVAATIPDLPADAEAPEAPQTDLEAPQTPADDAGDPAPSDAPAEAQQPAQGADDPSSPEQAVAIQQQAQTAVTNGIALDGAYLATIAERTGAPVARVRAILKAAGMLPNGNGKGTRKG